MTNVHQQRYNDAHSKTRCIIERTFGRVKRRFGSLHQELRVTPERVCKLITAGFILHNISLLLNVPQEDDANNTVDQPILELCATSENDENGIHVRQNIVNNYF